MSKITSEHSNKEPRRMFQVPAIIGKIQTMTDGGSKIDMLTGEMTPEDATKIKELIDATKPEDVVADMIERTNQSMLDGK